MEPLEDHTLEVDETLAGERLARFIERYMSPLAAWSYSHNCGCDKRRVWLNDRHEDIRDLILKVRGNIGKAFKSKGKAGVK